MLEYWTGISQPPKSTILAPILRCAALSGVALRPAAGCVMDALGADSQFYSRCQVGASGPRRCRPRFRLGARNYFKAADGGGFVVKDLEYSIDLGELHDILNPLRKLHELEFSAATGGCGVGGNEFTQTAGIDVVDFGHIQKDVFPAALERIGDQLPKLAGARSKCNGAGEIHDQDVPYFPVKMFEGHGATVAPRGGACQQPKSVALLCVGNSHGGGSRWEDLMGEEHA